MDEAKTWLRIADTMMGPTLRGVKDEGHWQSTRALDLTAADRTQLINKHTALLRQALFQCDEPQIVFNEMQVLYALLQA